MKRCPTCGTNYPDDANFCAMDAVTLVSAAAPVPIGSDLTGALLGGRYFLGERLGGRRTGPVRLAKDSRDGTPVVIKRLAHAVVASPMVQERIMRELKQLEKLQAPGVVRHLEHGRTDEGDLFVVMEVAIGETLETLVDRHGRLSPREAVALALNVGAALAEAQKLGVVHRDLAPKNLLVRPDGGVTVLNFCFPVPGPDRIFGVAEYVSPEQVEGKTIDQRSNLYSLAAVLYFALVGEPPFQGDSPQEIARLHVLGAPRPPSARAPGIPEALDRSILKALERTTSRRHLTLRQLLGELGAALPSDGAPATSKAPRATRPAPLPAHTPPRVLAAGARERAGTAQTMHGFPALEPAVGLGAAATSPALPPVGAPLAAAPQAAGARRDEPAPQAGSDPGDATEPALSAIAHSTPNPRPATAAAPAATAAPPATTAAPAEPLPPAPSRPIAATAAPAEPLPTVPSRPIAATAAPAEPLPAVPSRPIAATAAPRGHEGASRLIAPTGAGAPAARPDPAAPVPARGTAERSGRAAGKGGFRETLWFKQGEVEAERAAREALDADASRPHAVLAAVTAEDRQRLSLHTGQTEMVPRITAAELRGDAADAMSASELLKAMNRPRRFVAVVVGVGALATMGGVLFYLLTRPAPPPPAAAPVPLGEGDPAGRPAAPHPSPSAPEAPPAAAPEAAVAAPGPAAPTTPAPAEAPTAPPSPAEPPSAPSAPVKSPSMAPSVTPTPEPTPRAAASVHRAAAAKKRRPPPRRKRLPSGPQ